MQDQLSGASSQFAGIRGDDRHAQALVLDQILVLYPKTLTFEELVREMSKGSSAFSDRDKVHRAVRELSGAGLLHRVGTLVLPTRAACHLTDINSRLG